MAFIVNLTGGTITLGFICVFVTFFFKKGNV